MPESTSLRTVWMYRIGVPLIVFAAVGVALALANSRSSMTTEAEIGGSPVVAADAAGDEGGALAQREPTALGTEGLIATYQQALRENPDDAGAYAALGDAYYQRARETGDPSFFTRAERAFQAALARSPEDFTATTGLGTLALARHDFAAGLELGQRAHDLEPRLARPFTVIADAQIELGRYAAAGQTIDRLVRLKPTLAAYTRVSYYRELHGDLDGAVRAMRLAVSAGGGSVENGAYVRSLLGGLEFDRGRYAAAERAWREALALDPGYAPALAGLARIDGGRGRYGAAIRAYRRVVELLPLPEYATALAETEQAAGMTAAARRNYALVEAQSRLLEARGIDTGVEEALFEADHGSAAKAVAAGRDAWRRTPSVRSADAYSWALLKAGRIEAARRFSARAMRLGSRTPSFLYHAGMIARAAGRPAAARAYLGTLVDQSARFNPLHGPRAERALEELQ